MTTVQQSISTRPLNVGAVFRSAVWLTVVFLVVGCDNASTPKTTDPASDGIEPSRPSSSSLEDRLVGDWSLDRAATISVTNAAAERAGKGQASAEAALRDYLKKASPDEDSEIRELVAEGTSAKKIMAFLNALETEESVEEATEVMVSQIEDLDLAFDAKFDGEEFRTEESRQAWRYSASETEDSSSQATLELSGNGHLWTMNIDLEENTLTIDANEEFHLNLGTPPEQIATLPSPMLLVFKRSAAAIPEDESGKR